MLKPLYAVPARVNPLKTRGGVLCSKCIRVGVIILLAAGAAQGRIFAWIRKGWGGRRGRGSKDAMGNQIPVPSLKLSVAEAAY